MDTLRKIADAVLYEGYILWPYRRSALKNQQRWTFGGVYPPEYSKSTGGTDRSLIQTQCLVEAEPRAVLDITIRFLHVVERRVARVADAGFEEVDELVVGGRRYLTWDEAIEREFRATRSIADLESGERIAIDVPAGSEKEPLDEDGKAAGALIRTWETITAVADLRVDRIDPGLYRITVTIENRSPSRAVERQRAIRHTLASTHTIVHSADGGLVSMTDPLESLAAAARACKNLGTWPVLVGEEGERHTILSSPIIMYDYPRVAPESPGDLFDGGEIDQLLILNILSLTDEEKSEMAASDPRARAILERTSALGHQELMRLHGAIRDFHPLEH